MEDSFSPDVPLGGRSPSHALHPARLIRLAEVMRRVGLGRSTIYRWMGEGRFPKPVKLGAHMVAWPEDTIDVWIASTQRDRLR